MKKRSFGIICEFNPLHNGHKRLIDEARARGADNIVCVMSGNAVQRGELAVLDKYTRAKAALLCGADLVLELPYPWCAASAEYFARAGVELLSDFCDTVIFGSECGDIELMKKGAKCASNDLFKTEFQSRLEKGEGAAKAYFTMLRESVGVEFSSNDLLGVEYIKAAIEQGLSIDFQTLKREGNAYNDQLLGEKYPSATAIRSAWSRGETACEHIPREAYGIFQEKILLGEVVDTSELARAVLMYFRLADVKMLSRFAEVDEGIANRIVAAAKASRNEKEFFENLATKRYTDAKLRRAILFSLTGVERELLREEPKYTTVLATNEKGRGLLSVARKQNGITIVTKPADAPRDNLQFEAEEKLGAIFTLATKKSFDTAESYRKHAFIE